MLPRSSDSTSARGRSPARRTTPAARSRRTRRAAGSSRRSTTTARPAPGRATSAQTTRSAPWSSGTWCAGGAWSGGTTTGRSTRPWWTGCSSTPSTRRAPGSARAGRSCGSTSPDDLERFWRATTPEDDGDMSGWLAGMRTAPVVIVPLSQQGRLPRPVRPAGQGLDRPRRVPLAGPLLAHRHRHGHPADPADRRRRGARRLLLRHPAGAASTRSARRSASPATTPRSARSPSATGPRIPAAPGSAARRPRRTPDEVVHHGRWGGTG